jgi:hypothetical protein
VNARADVASVGDDVSVGQQGAVHVDTGQRLGVCRARCAMGPMKDAGEAFRARVEREVEPVLSRHTPWWPRSDACPCPCTSHLSRRAKRRRPMYTASGVRRVGQVNEADGATRGQAGRPFGAS